jgi:hypothetical protein
MAIDEARADAELRDRAISRLKKRRDFFGHLLVYVLVNTFLVVVWLVTSDGGFFWPVFFIAGWGIGVVMNAWDVFRYDAFGERRIRQEMDRIHRHE